MASNLKYSTAAKNAQQDAIATLIGNGGKARLYDGTQPASPDVAVTTQNMLVECVGASPFAPASANGVLTAGTIASGTGTAAAGTGKTPTWYRIFKADGTTAVVDGTVGQTGCDLNLDNPSIAQNQAVKINSYTLANQN
ncbi:hypothetical protein QCE63_32015 [Caballeronia sp. LZ065]|uniref:hypothetical protein n=1 Tax=Caballeronia sp. LZ065 TaxID=3038571 RepID=UPI00285F1D4A|nr:hypothetical protein [Caballeronia sp. LZ065]MDR5784047.1 hypothetical protein [Caballeronia sp. LZ065]